jgi:hypothetical protein
MMMRNAKNNHKSIGVRAKSENTFLSILDPQRRSTETPTERPGTCVLLFPQRGWHSNTKVSICLINGLLE